MTFAWRDSLKVQGSNPVFVKSVLHFPSFFLSLTFLFLSFLEGHREMTLGKGGGEEGEGKAQKERIKSIRSFCLKSP